MVPVFPKPVKDIVVPLYDGRIILYTNRAKFLEALRAVDGPEDDDMGTVKGMCLPTKNEEGARLYIVGWFDGELPTLVHEVCHVTLFVLGNAGIEPRDSQGEPMCYLLDYIFGQLTSKNR
jgi:hypothetical protein